MLHSYRLRLREAQYESRARPLSATEIEMANSMKLELLCRLFLGLFVGFFCITALLFVRYKPANSLPQVPVEQSKGISHGLPRSIPAVPVSSASQSQGAATVLDVEARTLIASSASTVVTFIALAVASFLSWRKDKRRRPRKSGTPPSRLPN